MSEIIIGSARSAKLGGKDSVSEQKFYTKPWKVIHPRKASHRHGMAMSMRNACTNDNITYSMEKRAEIYRRGTDSPVPCHADCSSLVTQCIKENITVSFPNSTTATLVDNAKKYPELFEIYDLVDTKTLWNGDILVYRENGHGHTVIVTHNGRKNK